ncbi:MAG: methyltransferase domain-containing protein [Candidatus Omnitrophica bacterium]|nr:methyltransferase domain-containing protein [Candidatus Omnitrophota bacterium]
MKRRCCFGMFARRMIIGIIPPVITDLLRIARNRFFGLEGKELPKPGDYSTVDAPQEIPGQVEDYIFCRDQYLNPADKVLDVGFGLGYGLNIMAAKVTGIVGLEVDDKALKRAVRVFGGHEKIQVLSYDGKKIPFGDKSFDAVTCIEVLEHIEDYENLLLEMVRVARKLVFIATPNRRPEYTLRNGKPKNYWHLREWTEPELKIVFDGLRFTKVEWNFLNGPFEGPFFWTKTITPDTFSLVPVIIVA